MAHCEKSHSPVLERGPPARFRLRRSTLYAVKEIIAYVFGFA
jgi:hypothetical protein